MPGFPIPGRPGGEDDEPLLDMIIARRALPPDAPQAMHDLERMLAVLAGPAEPGELAGEAAVRAAFSRAAAPAGVSSAARRPVRHRRTRRTRERLRSRVKLATVMVVAAAGLGSVLVAHVDVLPSPIEHLAHVAAAPAPQPTTLGTGRAEPRKAPASSGQASAPHHPAGADPACDQWTNARRHHWPHYPPSGRGPAGAACQSCPQGWSPGEPAYPNRSPYWYQPRLCTTSPGWPAGQPPQDPDGP
jgi:hypothetical protein